MQRNIGEAENKTERNESSRSKVPGLYALDLKTKSIKTSKRSKISIVSNTYLREADTNLIAPKISKAPQSYIREADNNMNSLPTQGINTIICEKTILITIQQFPKEIKYFLLFHTVDSCTILVETLVYVKFSTNTIEILAVYDNVTDGPT